MNRLIQPKSRNLRTVVPIGNCIDNSVKKKILPVGNSKRV